MADQNDLPKSLRFLNMLYFPPLFEKHTVSIAQKT